MPSILAPRDGSPQRTISWSKHGFVAYVPQEHGTAHNLCLTYLETAPGETWQLAPPQNLVVRAPGQHASPEPRAEPRAEAFPRLDVLSWSLSGTDLAAIDVHGNMTMLIAGAERNLTQPGYSSSSYNRLEIIYQDTAAQAALVTTTNNSFDLVLQQSAATPAVRAPLGSYVQRYLEDSPSKVIAFKWLNLDKPIIACHPAVRMETTADAMSYNVAASLNAQIRTEAARSTGLAVETEIPVPNYAYTYGVQQYKAHGPMHPVPNKQACLAVRRNGEVVLWYQGEHGLDYHRMTRALDAASTDHWLSHTAIGFQRDGSIIVATFSNQTREVRLYRVTVNWGYLVTSSVNQLKSPAYQTPDDKKSPSPALTVTRILREKVLTRDDTRNADGSPATLTHIELISPNYNSDTELDLLLAFEHDGCTAIHRYQLSDQPLTLHAAFLGLGERRGTSAAAAAGASLVLKEMLRTAQRVLSIGACSHDTYVAITYASGEVDLVNRRTQKRVHASVVDEEEPRLLPSTIFSIFDVGYKLPPPVFAPLVMLLSPNLCGYIAMGEGGLVYQCAVRKCIPARLTSQTNQTSRDEGVTSSFVSDRVSNSSDPNFSNLTSNVSFSGDDFSPTSSELAQVSFINESMLSTVVALAYRYSAACFSSLYSDDMLAVIKHEIAALTATLTALEQIPLATKTELADNFILSLLKEAHKAINFSLDYNRDQIERLLTSPPLQKLLSLQSAIGRNPFSGEDVSVHVAEALLTLRMVSFGLMLTLKSVYQQYHKVQKKVVPSSTAETALEYNFRAEHFASVLGIVRWGMDLIILINQDMLDLSSRVDTRALHEEDAYRRQQKLLSSSIAAPLLLGKIPRALLLYCIVGIKRLYETLKKLAAEAAHVDVPQSIVESSTRLKDIITSSPVPIDRFELFLTGVDKLIRSWESSMKAQTSGGNVVVAGPPSFSALALESTLVLQGRVPFQMFEHRSSFTNSDRSLLLTLMTNYQIQLKPKVNLVSLFFYDVRWLGLTVGAKTGADGSAQYDSLRKTMLIGDARLRKCVRCGTCSAVKDTFLYAEKYASLNFWTIAHHRNCVCGSCWVNL